MGALSNSKAGMSMLSKMVAEANAKAQADKAKAAAGAARGEGNPGVPAAFSPLGAPPPSSLYGTPSKGPR